jgi:hypothetical protein
MSGVRDRMDGDRRSDRTGSSRAEHFCHEGATELAQTMTEPSQVDDEIDALYGLRPGEFVGARDALAKRLRAAGDRDAADAVGRLARPTVAAWAINAVVRNEPEWTQALVTAGRRLEEAQQALIEQGDRGAWRDATAAQREAVDRLARLADDLVRQERGSVSTAVGDAIRETLHAASIDPDAREAVCAARLEHELRAVGLLGADAAPAPAPAPAAPSAKPRAASTSKRRPAAAKAQRDDADLTPRQAEAKLREDAEAKRRKDAETKRRKDAETKRREAERQEAERREAERREAERIARETLSEAEQALAEAQESADRRAAELDAAAAADRAAQEALDAAQATVAAARAALERALSNS